MRRRLPVEAPSSSKLQRQWPWSIRLKAFSKSTPRMQAAWVPQSSASSTWSQISESRWSAPHFRSPPYCPASSSSSPRSFWWTTFSRILLRYAVQLMLRHSDRSAGLGFFGMMVIYYFFHLSGQVAVELTALKIAAIGGAKRAGSLWTRCTIRSPGTPALVL